MKTIGATRPPGADEDTQAVIRQARRRQRRRQLITGAVLVLMLGGALGGYAASAGTSHPGPARPVSDSGHRPQPRSVPPSARWTATVQARVPIPLSDYAEIAVLGSTAWVAEWDNGLVVRVDLAARRVTKVLHIGNANHGGPISITAGSGSVWVLRARVLRIDPATGTVTNRIQIPGEASAVAYGDGFVWATGGSGYGKADMRLYKIDPARNVIVRAAPIPGNSPDCPVFPGPQGLWLGCGRHDGITLIDPVSLKPLKAVPVNTDGYGLLAAPGQRVVWVLTSTGLVRVDPATARVTGTVKINWGPDLLPFQPSAFAVDRAGQIWVANSTLDVLTPGSRAVQQVASTAWTNIINVVTAGPHLWVDNGLALEELDVHQVLAKP